MKRSEALSKLKHFMGYQNPYDDREIEDQILDYCERVLGMLPPKLYDIGDEEWLDVSTVIACANLNPSKFQWEPEDE